MDDTKKRNSEIWKKYRHIRLTLEELNTIIEGGRIPDKEHKASKAEKYVEKGEKYLKKYKLNDIDEKDLEIIKQISDDLYGL